MIEGSHAWSYHTNYESVLHDSIKSSFCGDNQEIILDSCNKNLNNELNACTNNPKTCNISSALVSMGINKLKKEMLIQELEMNGLPTHGLLKELQERLHSCFNTSTYESYSVVINSNTVYIPEEKAVSEKLNTSVFERKTEELEKFSSSVEKNKNAILNLEQDFVSLNEKYESVKQYFNAWMNNTEVQNLESKCSHNCDKSEKINIGLYQLGSRVERLEDRYNVQQEEMEKIANAVIQTDNCVKKCVTKDDLDCSYFTVISEQLTKISNAVSPTGIASDENDSNEFVTSTRPHRVDGTSYSKKAKNRVSDNRGNSMAHSPPRNRARSQSNERNFVRQQNVSNNRSKKKIVVLCDSLMRDFDRDRFSSVFYNEIYNIGSLKNLEKKPDIYRKVIAEEHVDGYLIEIGVNDLKTCTPGEVVGQLEKLITKLLSTSMAKITISLVLPVCKNIYPYLSAKIDIYNDLLVKLINDLRKESAYRSRLYTIFHTNFLKSSPENTKHLFSDGIHLSEAGSAVFFANLKLGLYKSFQLQLNRNNNPQRPRGRPDRPYV